MRVPTNYKFRKYFKANLARNNFTLRSFKPLYGNYCLKSTTRKPITENQIENIRIFLRRKLKRNTSVWIKVFPWSQLTKKSSFSRMGKGKGNHFKWVVPVKKGQILFEVLSIFDYNTTRFLYKSFSKLGVKTKVNRILY